MRKSNHERILVVDDERQVLAALEDGLEDQFDVVTTDDPGMALEIVERDHSLSVIISDERMPGMNGHELLARAREASDASRILITGFADLEAVVRAVNEGKIFGYVAKPWEIEDLTMLIFHAAEYFEVRRQLQHERHLLHSLMDNIPDSIYFKDDEFRYTRVNRAAAHLFGVDDPDDVVGHSLSEYVDPQSAEEIAALEKRVVERREPMSDVVGAVRDRLGARRWYSTTRAPILDYGDQVSGLVGVTRDVTERVRIEQELREREAGLRHAESMARLGHRYWNPQQRWFENWSTALQEVVGMDTNGEPVDLDTWLSMVRPDDRERVRRYYDELDSGGNRVVQDYEVVRPDGKLMHVQELVEPLEDTGLWFSTVQDVSLVVRQQQELRLLLSTTRGLAESVSREDALERVLAAVCEQAQWHYGEVWMQDSTGVLVCQEARYVRNDRLEKYRHAGETMTLKPGQHLPGRVWQSGQHEWYASIDELAQADFVRLEEAKRAGISSVAFFPVARGDGRTVAVLGFATVDEARIDPGFVETLTNVASQLGVAFERLDAVQEVRDRDLRFRSLAENLPGIIYTWVVHPDGTGETTYMSPKAKELLGGGFDSDSGAVHELWRDVIHPDDLERYQASIDEAVRSESTWQHEFRVLHPRDGVRWLLGQSTPHRRESGELVFDSLLLDMTKRREAEEEVRYLKQFDPLTGLPNRFLFIDRLKLAIDSLRPDEKIGIIHLSLDQYAFVADTLGHEAVDALVLQFRERVADSLQEHQTMGRPGGNDFTILLPGQQSLDEITARVAELQLQLDEPFWVNGHEIHATASIGISVGPDDAGTAAELLRDSSAARDRVDREGGDGYQFFAEDMTSRAISRLSLESRLRRALGNDEFELFYQSIVRTRDTRIVGAEALIRWRPPEGGLRSPGEFVSVLEDSGLIVPVGQWVIHEVCRDIRRLADIGYSGLRVHLNISPRQLIRANVLEQIQQAVASAGIQPQSLELELTETALMESFGAPREFLDAARESGVSIAIDDFGTGYSSLGYLRDFPVDTLKIDRSFVEAMITDAKSASLVNAIIMMARGFDMQVAAEGVETEQQLTYLRAYNCDLVQGFHFHRPEPFDDFISTLEESGARGSSID